MTTPPPLALADFDARGLETVVLGLVEAGAGSDLYRHASNGGPVGTLDAASDMELRPGQDITRIAIFDDGEQLRIWDNPSQQSLASFFGAGGGGDDLTLYVQTTGGLAVGTYLNAGSNFANFAIADSAQRALLTGIGAGDRFIIALARTGEEARPEALRIAIALPPAHVTVKAAPQPLRIGLALSAPVARDKARPRPLRIGLALPAPAVRKKARPEPLPIALALTAPRVTIEARPLPLRIGLTLVEPAWVHAAARYARSLRESAPERALLTALEIGHPAVAEPVRVINDTVGRRIEGHDYVALRFDARLADDVDGQVPQAELAVDNVGRALTQWIEATGGGIGATVRVMLVLDIDDPPVEWEVTLDVAGMAVDQERVTARLGFDPLLGRAAVALRHDPQTSPGLF